LPVISDSLFESHAQLIINNINDELAPRRDLNFEPIGAYFPVWFSMQRNCGLGG